MKKMSDFFRTGFSLIKKYYLYIPLFLWGLAPIFATFVENTIDRTGLWHLTEAGESVYTEDYYMVFYPLKTLKYTDMCKLFARITFLLVAVYALKKLIDNKDTYVDYVKSWFVRCFKERRWEILFLIMFLWTIVCSLFAEDHHIAVFGRLRGCEGIIMYAFYIGVYLCMSLLKRDKLTKLMLNLVVASTTFTSVFIIIADINQLYGSNINFFSKITIRPGDAMFFQFNHCGYFLNVGIICTIGLFLYEKRLAGRIIYGILCVLEMYGMIINDTFGCILASFGAAIFVGVIYCIRNNKGKYLGFLPIGLYLLTMVIASVDLIPRSRPNSMLVNLRILSDDAANIMGDDEEMLRAGTGRLGIWLDTIEMIKDSPIVGYGPMQIGESETNILRDVGESSPHNEYLQHGLYFGVPGFVIYLLALFALYRNRLKKLKELSEVQLIALGCVTAYLFSAMFGNTLCYTVVYLYLFMGLLCKRGSNDDKNTKFFHTNEENG